MPESTWASAALITRARRSWINLPSLNGRPYYVKELSKAEFNATPTVYLTNPDHRHVAFPKVTDRVGSACTAQVPSQPTTSLASGSRDVLHPPPCRCLGKRPCPTAWRTSSTRCTPRAGTTTTEQLGGWEAAGCSRFPPWLFAA